MDLTNQQIKDTYGNVLTIGATAGSPQTGTLQNGEGLNITSATLTGGTVTTSNPLLDMTQTWNDAGVTFTSLKLNVTDTASGANSLLLDLQVGGTAKAQILKDGRVSSRKGYVYAKPQFFDGSISEGAGFQIGNASSCHIYGNNTATFSVEDGTNGIRIAGNLSLGFVNGHAIQGASDVRLYRDAAYTLAQRVGTNAQTFNIYNTYTDGSNYERGFLKWDTNVLEIGTEALGTGTQRNVKIDVGTGSVTFAVGSTGRTIIFGDEITTTAAINMSAKNIDNTANIYPDGDDSYIIGEISTDKYYKAIYAYDHHLKERSADPSDPSEGKAVMWQSDGTGTGDDGDILIKITAGGVTKTATLVDFSAI